MKSSSHTLDRVGVTFDDDHQFADAGLILAATLAQHLGLKDLLDHHIDLGDAPGGASVGHKAMTLIHSALAGGDCIEDADALRAGETGRVLGHEVRAPSTLGTFLRGFTWGHVRQLDKASGELLGRAWAAGAGPGDRPLFIDVDSTICETYGLAKQGGVFGYSGVRGYHPLLAVVAGTGDVIHSRLRGGNAYSGRGAAGFITEAVGRVRAAGATGQITLRADSGFYARSVVQACGRAHVRFSITVKLHKPLVTAIEAIPEQAWVPIPYFADGADVAEATYTPFGTKGTPVRLIVRRVRPTPGTQLHLLVPYTYHAFVTDREGDTLDLEADHRRHAEVENAVRDLKYGVGLNHLPSGRFGANGCWLGLNVIAHNLARWVCRIGLEQTTFIATKTIRRRFLSVPGRLTRSGRQRILHLPTAWPWAMQFIAALMLLRTVRLVT